MLTVFRTLKTSKSSSCASVSFFPSTPTFPKPWSMLHLHIQRSQMLTVSDICSSSSSSGRRQRVELVIPSHSGRDIALKIGKSGRGQRGFARKNFLDTKALLIRYNKILFQMRCNKKSCSRQTATKSRLG